MHTPFIDIVFEYQQLYNFEYRIAQKLTVENFDESDKWLAISQNFSLLTFSSYEAYNQFIKVLLFKVSCVPHLSKFFAIIIVFKYSPNNQVFI